MVRQLEIEVSVDNEFDAQMDEELQRRLTRMESEGCGGMVQTNLPWSDFLITIGVLGAAAALLLWWAA